MSSTRRRSPTNAATRALLVEAAEQLVLEDGYAALTSRTLADRLQLTRAIVHYYFESIDDVFIALVQRSGAKSLERLQQAAASENPVRAVWETSSDRDQARLTLELYALACHRPAVRAEVKRFAEQFRELQTHALSRYLKEHGIEPRIKPVVATVLGTCMSQILALEQAIDITMGHAETHEFVENHTRTFERELKMLKKSTQKQTRAAKKQSTPKPRKKAKRK